MAWFGGEGRRRFLLRASFVCALVAEAACGLAAPHPGPLPSWPEPTQQARPWAYWWWMGSAVDRTNLTRELTRYRDAGLGGVHIIPIYGAKGYEAQFIDYLSPEWMEMLAYTVGEAHRLGLGVDMTTGTGWCFGGPTVSPEDANAAVVARTFEVAGGKRLTRRFEREGLQALMAFSTNGQYVDLSGSVQADGQLDWRAPAGAWRVYAVSQRPSGQQVKRAAPGGKGPMLNLFYPEAMRHYLVWFANAFANYTGPKPRALYQDSYEYRSDWAPGLFAEFEKRRGYRLQTELPALFSNLGRGARRGAGGTGGRPAGLDEDHIARVKADYRETLGEIMAEESLPLWVTWAHRHGFLTRNEAHGSPGNWLDLYALADIPETEMFSLDRNRLVSKFASSAAHVAGRPLAAAETGTWLKEHFTGTLADMKYLLDDMFLSGINHVFYHGTCYSPDTAAWPGWEFYASFEMNPRNPIWRDVGELNAYVGRCQAVLQSGHADNDVLLYWPLADVWHNPNGLVHPLTVHARDWFEDQPMGRTAEWLWQHGYAFDYVSDQQLAQATVSGGRVTTPGGSYQMLLLPPTGHLPLRTLAALARLAQDGATVFFETNLPADVPGWGHLSERREAFKALLAQAKFSGDGGGQLARAELGRGRWLLGTLAAGLAAGGVAGEPMFAQPGLMCVRRSFDGGWYYFVANGAEQSAVQGWVGLSRPAKTVLMLDPLTGRTGAARLRQTAAGPEVYLALAPGESVLLRASRTEEPGEPRWAYWAPAGPATPIPGRWRVRFLEGGPVLPAAFETDQLGSWTARADTNAQRFAGTARYAVEFDAPSSWAGAWQLALGRVCQSARVRLNGKSLGTLIAPPFTVAAGRLKARGNRLEIEVTNVGANRIRDLDRRGVNWKNFYDVNYVGIDYKPFDAANWPLTDSGLLGPVTLQPIKESEMEHEP